MAGLEQWFNRDTEVTNFFPPWAVWKGVKGEDNKYAATKQGKEEWFKDHLKPIQEISRYRIETHINNLLWYTGEYDKTFEYRMIIPARGEQPIPRRMLPRIFNHLFDITEQRVSRLSRYKPSFDVAPTNNESNDQQTARLIKTCLQAIGRRVHMDFMMQSIERWTAVFGEVLVGIDWNNNIGDRAGFATVERIGDVDIYIKEPWTYFPEPKAKWEDVTWCIDIFEIMHYQEARVKYEDKTIEPDGRKEIFDFNRGLYEKREDEVIIWRLIQRPTQYIPEGNISYFVNDKLVKEEKEYPYSHMEFPFERHTDIDVPGRLFPISFYQQLLPIQHVYNRLTSVMTRNLLYVGHPHILNPIGSGAKRESFGNAPTEIRFNPVGGFRPEVLTFKSVPQEFFQFRNEIRGELNQVSGIQGVSRGAPPSGVRAASMLRFFAEQEEQRASTQIIKHNELIRRIYQKAASLVGDYYPEDEERLVRVVGPENQYLIDSFDKAKISSQYDVIIVNSTGFSEDMSGRLEEIGFITQLEKESGEQIMTVEQKADVLQLRNPQKAYDILTASLKTAERNIEEFRRGRAVPEPQRYWDLITHWRTLMIFLNSPEWQTIEEGRRGPAIDHLEQLERLMEEKAKSTPAFAAQLEKLEGFPAQWSLTVESTPEAPAQPQPQPGPMPAPGPMPEQGAPIPPPPTGGIPPF